MSEVSELEPDTHADLAQPGVRSARRIRRSHDRRAVIRLYELLVSIPVVVYLIWSVWTDPQMFTDWYVFAWAAAVMVAELLPVPTNVSMGFSLSFPLELSAALLFPTPTAAAILTAIGDMHTYHHGKQLVKLAGLDPRLFESGSSIRKLPQISHVGSAYLRYWLYHYAMRLIAHEPPFQAYYQRRKQQSPGKGSGQRALIAVCDKTIRMIYRILRDHAPYNPKKDKSIAEYYAAQRQAA